jgi:hypothetical protein
MIGRKKALELVLSGDVIGVQGSFGIGIGQ